MSVPLWAVRRGDQPGPGHWASYWLTSRAPLMLSVTQKLWERETGQTTMKQDFLPLGPFSHWGWAGQ